MVLEKTQEIQLEIIRKKKNYFSNTKNWEKRKMKLRTGKNVPFLNKNFPKRKYTKSYKSPISKEEEDDLVSSFANISLCDNVQSTNKQSVLATPRKRIRLPKRKSLVFSDNDSTGDEDEPAIQKINLSKLPFNQNEDAEEVESEIEQEIELVEVIGATPNEGESLDDFPDAVPISDSDEDDDEENVLNQMEDDLIVFSAAEENKSASDVSGINSEDFGPAKDEEYISDALPVFDTDDDESDDDANEIERIFLSSTPSQLRIGSVISFLQQSMNELRSN